MNNRLLYQKSIRRYKSFHRLIAIAVIVAVAVITGSLSIGDSVRGTLLKRVDERLGKTETIVFSRYSYLDEKILEHLDFPRGVLLLNGFVSSSGKLIPVAVWGVDDLDIPKGQTKINSALFDELENTKNLVLRLPTEGMVPLGSMFVSDAYTTSLRLELNSVINVEQGGNIHLKNEQSIPFNIFVNRDELADILGISGKINVILSDQILSKTDFDAAWNYTLSGLQIQTEKQITDIRSERIFLQDKVVETLCSSNFQGNRIFAYFANSIGRNKQTIPYSFITALDEYKGQSLNSDEIVLSDYAARRLNVRVNDTISIRYFVARQFKTLSEDSVYLRVSKIVPISDLQADHNLCADFPGLSNVERCTDWDSDLPIDMQMITDEDERYWTTYKNTPKALVSYSAFASRWKNAYGSATTLCIKDTSRLQNLSSEMFDIQLIYPREDAVVSAKSGVDFSSLFLSLGFFIILSAVILMIVPLSEMLLLRSEEIKLLQNVGFSQKRITKLLWRETMPNVLISAFAGLAVGLLYARFVLFLLGNVWKGATHTDGFKMVLNTKTLAMGIVFGVILALLVVYLGIKKQIKGKRSKVKGKRFYQSRTLTINHSPFTLSNLIRATLRYNKKQALLSFVTLASGVLIVFSVGLNRRGFADSSQIRTATGGFSLWCETSVPVYHNIQTKEGRAKLGLMELPKIQSVQVLKYSADDASCLNLNKVTTPNVLGIDMNDIHNSDFKISKNIYDCSDSTLFEKLKTAETSVYPALVDETVLTWGLMKKLGDTLVYTEENGKSIVIRLVGTIQNSIFQGCVLMDKSLFSEIWREISGSEVMLFKVPDNEIVSVKTLLAQALNDYGVRIMTCGERMKLFYSVTDTYLTIFLTLGGLGLLLGIFGFIIVVRKNLLAKTQDITMYRSLGFDEKRIFRLLYKENIIVPIFAIATGVLGSLLGVRMGFGNVSLGIWLLAAMLLALFVFCVLFFVRISVKRYINTQSSQISRPIE